MVLFVADFLIRLVALAAQDDHIVLLRQLHRPANGRNAALNDLVGRFGILHPGKDLPEDLIGIFGAGIV